MNPIFAPRSNKDVRVVLWCDRSERFHLSVIAVGGKEVITHG